MKTQSNAVKKEEINAVNPGPVGPVAPVVAMPKQGEVKKEKAKAGQNKEKVAGPVNYTAAQLESYLDSQRSGKAPEGKPFDQKISDTNFTDEDRKAIRDARHWHRASLSVGEAKAALLHDIRSHHWKMVAHRENAVGNKRAMRFHNPTVTA